MALLTAYWSFDFLLTSLLLCLAAYLYMTRKFGYWTSRGVKEITPVPFFGNFLDCCFFRISAGEWLESLHEQCKGLPYMGFYLFDKPALLVRDPELIKSILIKDFHYFADRHVRAGVSDTVGSANMFLLKNPLWKSLRNKITPAFTSGKLKKMFNLILAIGDELETHLASRALEGDGQNIDVSEIDARFTTDVIGSCVFGIHVNSLNDSESAFRKCGHDMFGFSYMRSLELMAVFFAQDLFEPLGLQFFSKSASDFMRNLFTKNLNARLEGGLRRDDFIDLLIDLKNIPNDDPHAFKFEGDNLVGQAATFFAAGFETSSTTMSFALYELTLQPDIQTRLRDELISALKETGGEFTYDMVMNMKYLDMVVAETLRKHPPLAFLDRVPADNYKLVGTGLVIEKGTPIYISASGVQHDPENYPDPDKFDPERFSDENKKNRASCTYLPFGEGPRNCVAFRFGLLQSKIGILKYIHKYELTRSNETLVPLRYDSKAVLLVPHGAIVLNCRKIRD